MRVVVALALALALEPVAHAAPKPSRPKLAVVIVIDQLRRSDLDRLGPYLKGGLRRMLDRGAVLDGVYRHANTYTGPGHAQIVSGSYGYMNGITQNRWFNRVTGRAEGMLYDPDAHPIDEPTPSVDEDVSPRNFIGTTVGDELRLATAGKARVVAVALKERGSLLLGGRTGAAYFFGETTGRMTSSTFHMPSLPPWVIAFNGQKLPDRQFGKLWERALPEAAYAGADDCASEGSGLGLGTTFPHRVDGGEKALGRGFYDAFTCTPFGIDYTFAFAKAAVEGEALGTHGVTDLLAISVSSTDLIGHNFGVYSHEVMDALVRADRAIGDFLGYLDRKLGPDNYIVVLTADHGATMPPEDAASWKLGGRRVHRDDLIRTVEGALALRFGAGPWVLAAEDPSIYLDWKKIDDKHLAHADVEEVAAEAVRALPGFAGAYTRTQIMRGQMPRTRAAEAIALSYFPARNGDVITVQAPFSFWGKFGEKATGGSHGSFYRYDTDVPLVFAGPPFRAGRYGTAPIVDIAATLARVLGVANPAGCEGEPLEQILR